MEIGPFEVSVDAFVVRDVNDSCTLRGRVVDIRDDESILIEWVGLPGPAVYTRKQFIDARITVISRKQYAALDGQR